MAGLSARAQPWAGLIGGAAGWFVSQQAGSNMVFADCARGQWWSVAVIGLLGLSLALGGAWLSWSSTRGEARIGWRFVGLLGASVAVLLSFPILVATVAALFVPGCLS